jgi:hypothetical protein
VLSQAFQTATADGTTGPSTISTEPDAPGLESISSDSTSVFPAARADDVDSLPPFPNPFRQPVATVLWFVQLATGTVTLLAVLTILSILPLLNFLALGYLLEAERRVAASGKLRHGVPLLPAARRIGSIAIGTLICLAPVMLLSEFVSEARLIAPTGTATMVWTAALGILSIIAGTHLVLALLRGGNLIYFARPLNNLRWIRKNYQAGDCWSHIDREWSVLLAVLRPIHHFRLGLGGFLGTWVWLVLPTALFGAGWYSGSTWYKVLTLASGACLIPVLAWAPFLQVRMAVEDRWTAIFEVRAIRKLFRHAPLSWLFAIALLYALSIPLFLYSLHLRLRVPFHLEIWWDLALVSIVCTLPARIALGWAYHRATLKRPASGWWVGTIRVLLGGALGLYVWLLFYAPATHEFRPWQLQYHALVLPVPW